MPTEDITEGLREQAIERIEARQGFWTHLTAYLVINGALTVGWFVIAGDGLFWPVFPLIGWGIGLIFHAIEVFHRPVTEQQIRREIQRLREQDRVGAGKGR